MKAIISGNAAREDEFPGKSTWMLNVLGIDLDDVIYFCLSMKYIGCKHFEIINFTYNTAFLSR